ncbi:putative CBS domain-containing protein [Streptomyces sp. Tu6071]|uniref:hemolysin family protein n=1 Tax=Streptomyces sp. Tu6071 TaxID=355249 RepID=UPI00020E6B28|nr:hemolysin family protein [Streptomyces sp. Tu6071]EGJ78859.1 putative CBS domain-containing protein [Streptomyces sp. Tu6071]
MTELLLLGLAVLLALACGVFVAAEFSLTTVERGALEAAARRGERGARHALAAVRRLTFQLSGAQLGITVTNLVIGMLAEPSVAKVLSGPLGALGLPAGAVTVLALVLGTALSTAFLMVVGELVPKNWAISAPERVARAVAGPLRLFSFVLRPLITHLDTTANRAVRRLGLEPAEEIAPARGPRELAALARHSARAGTLPAGTAELFVRTLGLGALTAGAVMTPRVDVVAVAAGEPAARVLTAARRTGLSRFPVHRGDGLDEVCGTVHVKDVLALPPAARAATPVRALLAPPVLVPATLPVDLLLDRLSGAGAMALVIDEYGGTAGLVTLEDVVEEVVGEVRDEHDPRARPALVRAGSEGDRAVWAAEGSLRVDRLAGLGPALPEGPYETLGGLVTAELGRVPRAGDTVRVAGWELRVDSADRRRAGRVRLLAPAPDARTKELSR